MNAQAQTWLVAGLASGQGKTTVTAAWAQAARRRGLRVRVFKTGADFLDPMVLAQASSASVRNLDDWLLGPERCDALIAQARTEADLVLIEGAMGLFDGTPSAADLAARLQIPVAVVVDASAMVQTFGAVVHGLAAWRREVRVCGAIANRVVSEAHGRCAIQGLREKSRMMQTGWMLADADCTWPERHLGLVQPDDVPGIAARLDRAADALHWRDPSTAWPDVGGALAAERAALREEGAAHEEIPGCDGQALRGVRIAIARDAAFCFLYADNLATLRALGAELVFFSPLADAALPACEAIWLPGGYPELHGAALARNEAMRSAIGAHCAQGRPLLAECGGMMSLFDEIIDRDGRAFRGFGILHGYAAMTEGVVALSMQALDLPEGRLRGHTFHHSYSVTPEPVAARARCPQGGSTAEAVHRLARVCASYVHWYFPSCPAAVAALFRP